MNTFKTLKNKYKIKANIKGPSFRDIELNDSNILERIREHYVNNEHHAWPDQPYYKGVGLHYSLASNIEPKEKQVCGYRDQPNYNDTMSYDREISNDVLRYITNFKTVRSKITEMTYSDNKSDQSLWHNDETPHEALRVIIPVESDPNFKFQLDNSEPIWLKPGRVYAFDQSIPHRVFCDNRTDNSRLHLILSIVTWFTYIEGIWVPNDHCDKTHPMELLDDLLIF